MKKLLLLIALIHFQVIVIGQTKQSVIVEIYPPNSFAKINDKVIDIEKEKSPFTLELDPGTYPIEIWSPIYNVFKDTIEVKNKTTYYTKGLIVQSEAYQAFKEEKRAYKSASNRKYFVASGVTLANLAGFWFAIDGLSIKKLKDLQDRAATLRDLQPNVASDNLLLSNRNSYETVQTDFEKQRKNLYLKRTVGIPIVAITSFLSWRYIKKMWSKKLIEPIFDGGRNPLVLKDIEIGTGVFSYNVNLKFEF